MTKLRQINTYFATAHSAIFPGTAVVVVSLLAIVLAYFSTAAQAQKRRLRKPAPRRSAPASAINYSKFSHATDKHKGACDSCHKIPTTNWQKVRGFPDVADYPGHESCVSCHRAQFFKGARPPICSVCHSKVSPRDDARFAFRNPASPSQFLINFPHDRHQDVIARLFYVPPPDEPQFVHASFKYGGFVADDQTKHYNNCEICHQPRSNLPRTSAAGWPDNFVPDPATFKASPGNHASCFNCHWKSQQPVNSNCGGCHRLDTTRTTMLDLPRRISVKFRHAREQHIAECTTCHINITKSATLRGLKPDVPITACTECHNKDGLRLDVSKELEALDKNREFVCTYCHTSDVGRSDPPASHYLIAERPPLKRKDLK